MLQTGWSKKFCVEIHASFQFDQSDVISHVNAIVTRVLDEISDFQLIECRFGAIGCKVLDSEAYDRWLSVDLNFNWWVEIAENILLTFARIDAIRNALLSAQNDRWSSIHRN